MLEFFYEKKDFYQLKEVERLCAKEKGINAMSIKEVLMGLYHDNLVDSDKIGTCVYFWAFPSKAGQKRKADLSDVQSIFESTSTKRKATEDSVMKAKKGKEDCADRTKVMENLSTLRSKRDSLAQELKKYRDCDPDYLARLEQDANVAKEAANRWTDNLFSIKSWIRNKFNIEESVIDKQFQIPENIDYIN